MANDIMDLNGNQGSKGKTSTGIHQLPALLVLSGLSKVGVHKIYITLGIMTYLGKIVFRIST